MDPSERDPPSMRRDHDAPVQRPASQLPSPPHPSSMTYTRAPGPHPSLPGVRVSSTFRPGQPHYTTNRPTSVLPPFQTYPAYRAPTAYPAGTYEVVTRPGPPPPTAHHPSQATGRPTTHIHIPQAGHQVGPHYIAHHYTTTNRPVVSTAGPHPTMQTLHSAAAAPSAGQQRIYQTVPVLREPHQQGHDPSRQGVGQRHEHGQVQRHARQSEVQRPDQSYSHLRQEVQNVARPGDERLERQRQRSPPLSAQPPPHHRHVRVHHHHHNHPPPPRHSTQESGQASAGRSRPQASVQQHQAGQMQNNERSSTAGRSTEQSHRSTAGPTSTESYHHGRGNRPVHDNVVVVGSSSETNSPRVNSHLETSQAVPTGANPTTAGSDQVRYYYRPVHSVVPDRREARREPEESQRGSRQVQQQQQHQETHSRQHQSFLPQPLPRPPASHVAKSGEGQTVRKVEGDHLIRSDDVPSNATQPTPPSRTHLQAPQSAPERRLPPDPPRDSTLHASSHPSSSTGAYTTRSTAPVMTHPAHVSPLYSTVAPVERAAIVQPVPGPAYTQGRPVYVGESLTHRLPQQATPASAPQAQQASSQRHSQPIQLVQPRAPPPPPPPPGPTLPPLNLPPQQETRKESPDRSPRQLRVEDALAYLEKVKDHFTNEPMSYNSFLDIMKDFKSHAINTIDVIQRVARLFDGHPQLILGFNAFLPTGYHIEMSEDSLGVMTTGYIGPHGFSKLSTTPPPIPDSPEHTSELGSKPPGPGQEPLPPPPPLPQPPRGVKRARPSQSVGGSSAATASASVSKRQKTGSSVTTAAAASSSRGPGGSRRGPAKAEAARGTSHHVSRRGALPQTGSMKMNGVATGVGGGGSAPTYNNEFERAMKFMSTVQERLTNTPDLYSELLGVIKECSAGGNVPFRDIWIRVSSILKDHKDLRDELKSFLPGGKTSGYGSLLGANQETVARIRGRGRSSAVHGKSSASQKVAPPVESVKYAMPDVRTELRFFDDVKALIPARQQYDDFLRCLRLFLQNIITKEDLLTMADDLFQEHPSLLARLKAHLNRAPNVPFVEPPVERARRSSRKEFVDYEDSEYDSDEWEQRDLKMEERPDNESETSLTSAERQMSYRKRPMSTIAAESVTKSTTSYRRLPNDFPKLACSSRGTLDRKTLNDEWVSVVKGNEDNSTKYMRNNSSEESMSRCEDDRYELDMVIYTNHATIEKLTPVADAITTMTPEEKEEFVLEGGLLKPIHFGAIRRVYGDDGPMVISHLRVWAANSVPIVLNRLHEADLHWRKARMELNKVWREVGEKNFYKSQDHRSTLFKSMERKDLQHRQLLNDILNPRDAHTAQKATLTSARGFGVPGVTNEFSRTSAAVAQASRYLAFSKGTGKHRHGKDSSRTSELRFLNLEYREHPTLHADMFDILKKVIDSDSGTNFPTPKDKGEVLKLAKDLFMTFFRLSDDFTACGDAKEHKRLFCGESFYTLFRLHHFLYDRLYIASMTADGMAADQKNRDESNKHAVKEPESINPAWKLSLPVERLIDDDPPTGPVRIPATDGKALYGMYLDHLKQHLTSPTANGNQERYEEKCRVMLGPYAYYQFTADKIVNRLVKQLVTVFVKNKELSLHIISCMDDKDGDVRCSRALRGEKGEEHVHFRMQMRGNRNCIRVVGYNGKDKEETVMIDDAQRLDEYLGFTSGIIDPEEMKRVGLDVAEDMQKDGMEEERKGSCSGMRKSVRRMLRKIDRSSRRVEDLISQCKIRNGLRVEYVRSGMSRYVASTSDIMFCRGDRSLGSSKGGASQRRREKWCSRFSSWLEKQAKMWEAEKKEAERKAAEEEAARKQKEEKEKGKEAVLSDAVGAPMRERGEEEEVQIDDNQTETEDSTSTPVETTPDGEAAKLKKDSGEMEVVGKSVTKPEPEVAENDSKMEVDTEGNAEKKSDE